MELPATDAGSAFVTVPLRQAYATTPLVFALIGSDGVGPAAVRIRNVTATSFEMAQVEPEGSDGPHEAETVHYLAVEPGEHLLPDGTRLTAGAVATTAIQHASGVDGAVEWEPVVFGIPFAGAPTLLTQIQTMANESAAVPGAPSAPWLVATVTGVDTTGFDVALERGGAASGDVTVPETVAWLAVDAGVVTSLTANGGQTVALETLRSDDTVVGWDSGPTTIDLAGTYATAPLVVGSQHTRDGGDGGWLRRWAVTPTAVDLVIDEDQALDAERAHTTEAVSLLAIAEPFDAVVVSPPQVQLLSSQLRAGEADGTLAVTVTLSKPWSTPISVDVVSVDGTATAGSDFEALDETVVIAADELSGSATLTLLDDSDVEGAETLTVQITGVSPGFVGLPDEAEVVLSDDDTTTAPGWRMEAGSVELPATDAGSGFVTVPLRQTYATSPLVFALIGSDGIGPAAVRVRNVTTTAFEMAQVEPEGSDGPHEAETVHYLAVEPGEHLLPDGTRLTVGTVATTAIQHASGISGATTWDPVVFATSFAAQPVLLTQIQTMANESASVPGAPSTPWLVATVTGVDTTGFDVALERGDAASGDVTVPETVAWLAVDAGAVTSLTANGGQTVALETLRSDDTVVGWDSGPTTIDLAGTYATTPLVVGSQHTRDGGDGGWLRRWATATTAVDLVIDEDQALDAERAHTTEAVSLLAIAEPFDAVVVSPPQVQLLSSQLRAGEADGTLAVTVTLSKPWSTPISVDVVSVDGTATAGSDFEALDETVVIAADELSGSATLTLLDDSDVEGAETLTVQITGVSPGFVGLPDEAEVVLSDDDTTTAPGWRMEAGSVELPATDAGSGFVTVPLRQTYATSPLVFALIGSDGIGPAAVRVRNVTTTAFEMAQVEPEGSDGPHEAETVHYLAVEPGEHLLPDGTRLTVGTVATTAIQHASGISGATTWDPVVFATSFAAQPVLLTQIQTMANESAAVPGAPSAPWLVATVTGVDTTGFDVALERGGAASGDVTVSETVAWLAVDAGAVTSLTTNGGQTVALETLLSDDTVVGWDSGPTAISLTGAYTTTPLVVGSQHTRDGGDGGWLRRWTVTPTAVDLVIDEDQALDAERAHTTEAVSLLAIAEPFDAVIDDTIPEPEVAMASATVSVAEGAGAVVLTVNLSEPPAADVMVDLSTADGTATAGSDYVALSETITIQPPATSGTLVLTILDDSEIESTEELTVSITAVTGAAVGDPATTTVQITDDDQPTRNVTFAVGPTDNQISGAASVSTSGGVATVGGGGGDPPVVRPGQRLVYGPGAEVVFANTCAPSGLECEVVTALGAVPPDTGAVELTELRNEFATLAEAVVGASDVAHLGTLDLVAANVELRLACYASGVPDTLPVAIDGWVTDAAHQLIVGSYGSSRHQGVWSDSRYALDVAGGPCLTTSTGSLVLEGLQLHCSGDPTSNIAGVAAQGETVLGTIEIRESIIRLDDAVGTGDRLGVVAVGVGPSRLLVRNTAIWDLGSGSMRHVGVLADDADVAVRAANVTVVGGDHGFRRIAGTFETVSSIATGAASSDFEGQFSAASSHNMSSDLTAPGESPVSGVAPSFLGATTGSGADLHLSCDLLELATVTHSAIDVGGIENVFDGDPRQLARSAGVNPAWVQLEFASPVTITGTAVALSHANSHNWMVAIADSAADMAAQSGSYTEVVPWQLAPGSNRSWHEAVVAAPATGSVVRLEVEKLLGDDFVHIGEWELQGVVPACAGGRSLALDDDAPFANDIDDETRLEPWDIGADEASVLSLRWARSNVPVWESEGSATMEVVLSRPSLVPVTVYYRTFDAGATATQDYQPVDSAVVVPAGSLTAAVTVPVIADGISDDNEWFGLSASLTPTFADVEQAWVQIRDVGESPVRVSLVAPVVDVAEDSGSATVEVGLSAPSSSTVSVNYWVNDGSARMGLDYSSVEGQLQFVAGSTLEQFDVPIIDDDLPETMESLLIRLDWTSAGFTAPSMGVVRIADDDQASVRFTTATATAVESASQVAVAVELTTPVASEVTVGWSTADGTATAGADYSATSGTVTFPANVTTGEIIIPLLDDTDPEDDETFTITLANPTGAPLGTPATATVVISDDEQLPTVEWTTASLMVDEDAGTATVIAALDTAVAWPVSVRCSTLDGFATAGADYQPVDEILEVAAGATEAACVVPIVDDALEESQESFSVLLSDPLTAELGSLTVATVLIADNELQADSVAFAVGPIGNQLQTTATVSIVSGVATFAASGELPQLGPGQRLEYGSGSVAYVVDCSSVDVCRVATAQGGQPADVSSASLTVIRNEFSSLAAALAGAGDVDHLGTYDLTVADVALDLVCYPMLDTSPVTVDGWVTDAAHPLTILAGEGPPAEEPEAVRTAETRYHAGSWSEASYRLEVAGGPCVTASIGGVQMEGLQLHCSGDAATDIVGIQLDQAAGDGPVEIAETLIRLDGAAGTGQRAGISAAPGFGGQLHVRNAVVWDLGNGSGIQVDAPSAEVHVANTTVVGGAYGVQQTAGSVRVLNSIATGATGACFAGTFDAGSSHNLSSDQTAPGGHPLTGGAVRFVNAAPGDTADLHLDCDPISDAVITHSQLDIGTVSNLFDNDPMRIARSASVNPAWVQLEYPEPVRLTGTAVALSYGEEHRWMVAIADSAADMAAQSGSYQEIVPWRIAPGPQCSWHDGEMATPASATVIRLTVEKTLGDDYVHIGEWELRGVVAACGSGLDLSADATNPVTRDVDGETRYVPWDRGADQAVPLSFHLRDASIDLWESEGQAVAEALLSRPVTQPVQLFYRTQASDASPGSDYQHMEASLTIPAGAVSGIATVPVYDDGVADDSEYFRIDVSFDPGFASVQGVWVRLRDVGDPPPRVALQSAKVTVDESAGSAVLTVVRDLPASGTVDVSYSLEEISARVGLDYLEVGGTLSFADGQTEQQIAVPILDDTSVEPDEQLVVHLGAVVGHWSAPSATVVTITDSDALTVGMASAVGAADEHATEALVAVELTGPADAPVSVDWTTADGTATAGEDYQGVSGTLTFDPGVVWQQISVPILDDTAPEGDETFEVRLSNPAGIELGSVTTTTITILDDEDQPTLQWSEGAVTVAEAEGSVTLVATLSASCAWPVTFQCVTADGTATAGSDYTWVDETVEIPAGSTAASCVVDLITDSTPEDDETFTVSIAGPTGAVAGAPTSATITIVEIPVVAFASLVFEVLESRNLTVPLAISQQATEIRTVDVVSSDGSALAGEDYNALQSTVYFWGSTLTASTTLQTIDDDLVEPDEELTVTLANPDDVLIGEPSTATVVIIDDDTPKIRSPRLVHVEPDLVHLSWWTMYRNDTTTVERRDADAGGTWELLATIDGTTNPFWRDFLVQPGVRYEYRLTPYDTVGDPGIDATVTMDDPVPSAGDAAAVTVVPGMAEVVPNPSIPPEANLWAGAHDYVFHLAPDPGPDFVGCTVDVYVDDTPAGESADEPYQPWVSPFDGLARDELGCLGAAGELKVAGHPCNGPQCDVTVPALTAGTHSFRFVITDAQGHTSQRVIVQDMQPWQTTNALVDPAYPLPVLYLFSDQVVTSLPSFWVQGPALVSDGADCSDRAEPSNVYGYRTRTTLLVPDGDESSGLLVWNETSAWADGVEDSVRLSRSSPARLGRDLLSRDVAAPQLWTHRQELGAYGQRTDWYDLTADLGASGNVTPAVTWLTPFVNSEDDAAELWTTAWLRIEDVDHDVDAESVAVANLTRDGGAELFQAYYADPSLQVRPEGSYGWFVVRLPLVPGNNQLQIAAEDRAGHVLDTTDWSIARHILVPGAYPVPVIDTPPVGQRFYAGSPLEYGVSTSTVPSGYQAWVGLLVDDGSDPMLLRDESTALSGAISTAAGDPAYRLRLVIATSEAMPSAEALRGADLPCVLGDPDLGCDSTEIALDPDPRDPFAFDTGYVLPEGVLLRVGESSEHIYFERSDDGGASWVQIRQAFWDYHYADSDVVEGETYHYRTRRFDTEPWIYLGGSTVGPGDAVVIPEWSAPRVVPSLDAVTWHCPDGASRVLCQGTLSLGLDPEPGTSLAGSTVRVFLNEATHQLTDGRGDPIPISWSWPAEGRDLPGCVVRSATPTAEVVVPIDQDSASVELPRVIFGANALRLEVETPAGEVSERALLIALHEEPLSGSNDETDLLMPVLLGDTFASADPVLWGFGPASRYSPDCRDGDLAYDFANQDPPEHSLYVNTLELSSGASLQTGTDSLGQWVHQLTLSDGAWELTQDGVTGASLQRGRVGRELLAADGVTVLAGLAATVASIGQRGPTDLIVDSSITDLAPQLSFVPAEVLVESPLPEGAGLLRFRLVDADHDVPLDGITVTNLSVTDPVATPAFYAAEQVDVDHGDWGWFVAELMLAEGMNTIEICAEDSQGHGLGTSTACVTHQVERRSPLVQAVVTSPDPDVSHAVRATEIIEFDGRASVIPEGGVGVWTLGTTSYLITPASWDPVTTRAQVDDVSQLATSFAVPVGQSLLVRARLVVAASPADLPADLWPDNGDLPCEGFEGEGRCDSVDVVLSRPCHRAPNSVIVYVDEPATSFLAVTPDETFRLRAHVNETETYAFRWVVQDVNDLVPEWWSTPLGPTVDNEGFSVANADLETSAALEGLPMGEYTIRAEARWPEYGCETSGYGWWYGAGGYLTLSVSHTFDGVAPGQVVEDGTFRVYSRSAAEGSAAVVRIDNDLDDATPPVTYPATVTTGGAIEITPAAGELPASAERYWVQIAADADGAGGSTWVRALEIVAPGSADTPLVVINEEDPSCGGQGSECTHPIVPGQTWQGEWGEPGDTDYFGFIAGAGTEIRVTLDRQDLTLPPLHPDAPSPEILLIRPDGLVYAASEPLGLDATGTVLEAVLPDDGQHAIAVRTSKGTGSYLLTLTTLAEGGSGEAVFGTTRQRAHLTTPSSPQAQLSVPLLDAFGNPTSGAEITWVEGTDCAEGFCGTGTQVTHRSSTDGFAWHEVTTTETSAPLWRPGLESATLLRAPAETMTAHRQAVAERLARAKARQPILGRVQVDGFAVRSASLPSLHRAKALRADAGRRADRLEAQSALEPRLKDGPSCGDNGITCSTDAAPEFRAVQLDVAADEQLVSVSLRVLDGPEEVTELDGHEIHSAIPLFLEANAVLRDGEGTERTIEITDPVAMVVTDDYGAGIEQAGSVCPYAALAPGSFTYWVGSHAAMQYQYDDPGTGEPCCWQPTEYLLATVIAEVEVDDGQGGSTLVRRATEIEVPSKPRPAATCELRPYPAGDGGPLEIAGDGPRASVEGFFSQWVGSVYEVDACGNIVITDQAPQVAGVAPSDPDVWATVQPTASHWEWQILLHGSASVSPDGTPLYYIPPNQYTVTLEADAATDCAPSGTRTYDHVIDYADSRAQIQLVWDAIRGDEPQDLTASPGAALRDPATGELATWRIRPGESGYWHTGQSWQDVPVRLYVAERRVYWNDDGTVAEDLKPVPNVELCIGTLHQSYDPASDDYPGDITVTCDDTHTGEVTITASTEPDTALEHGIAFDGEVGPVVGLKQAPEGGGEYVLVAEPVEDDPVAEPFRRGDAWRLATAGTGVRFSVWGGQYLDEHMKPFASGVLVGTSRELFIQLVGETGADVVHADVSFVVDAVVQSSVEVPLARVFTSTAGESTYMASVVVQSQSEASTRSSDVLIVSEEGMITTTVDQEVRVRERLSQLRVQIESLLDSDGVEITGEVIDVKEMAPLRLRYRLAGTEQPISQSIAVLEVFTDDNDQILTEFYGGETGSLVSFHVVEYPTLLAPKYYELEWGGRDTLGGQRILIEGKYRLLITSTVMQNEVPLNVMNVEPFDVNIDAPNASNYGPLYSHMWPSHDYSVYSEPARIAQNPLVDDTSYTQITALESSASEAAAVWTRLKERDAVMSWSGHSAPGEIHFYSSSEPLHDDQFWSALLSSRDILDGAVPDIEIAFVEDFDVDDLQDVFFVLLHGCQTAQPLGETHLSIPFSMVRAGVDIVLAFDDNTQWELGDDFSNMFWLYAGRHEDRLSIYEAQNLAAQNLPIVEPAFPQEMYDVYRYPVYYEAIGASKDDSIFPARYGIANN